MRVLVRQIVRRRVVFAKDLVSNQVIFSKCVVVPVPVPAAVGAAFGVERRVFLAYRHTELDQHLLKNRISLNLKEIFPELHRRVAIS